MSPRLRRLLPMESLMVRHQKDSAVIELCRWRDDFPARCGDESMTER